jgi:hypothetical protein
VGKHKALQELADSLGPKLAILAADIVQYRNHPSSLPIVMGAAERGRYVVLEGNRRLAARRALENPEVVADSVRPAVLKRLRSLSKQYLEKPIEKFDCVVVKNREPDDELPSTTFSRGSTSLPTCMAR